MPNLRRAAFHTTVADLRMLPADALREVAFVGRSNAGKSSAINTLCDHTGLAYVSKTPGRTQHLNYFSVRAGEYLVDLPGYGFAKAPEEVRKAWNGLIVPYLEQRQELQGLVLIMDCRHPLTPLDLQLLDWFLPTGRPVHVLLSKADKLTRQEQATTLQAVRSTLLKMSGNMTVQMFSSLKRLGVDEAGRVIAAWLSGVPALHATVASGQGAEPGVQAPTREAGTLRKAASPGTAKPARKARARKPALKLTPAQRLAKKTGQMRIAKKTPGKRISGGQMP